MSRTVRADVVGLIPAGGQATRLAPLPCSKELLPVGVPGTDRQAEVGEPRGRWSGGAHVEVVCHCLIERLRHAGVARAVVVLGHGKWDIPAYLGDGEHLGVQLAYVTVRDSRGAAFTVDRARFFVRDATVAFGFPDIVFGPPDVYDRLLDRLDTSGDDVTLALYGTDRPETADMVETAADGRVRRVEVKPRDTQLEHTWIAAVWTPAFTAYLDDVVQQRTVDRGRFPDGGEAHVGHVLQAGIAEGLRIGSIVTGGSYRDLGTPEGYAAELRSPLISRLGAPTPPLPAELPQGPAGERTDLRADAAHRDADPPTA